jgi:tetratricopeptide (TPR) repeat protein
LLVLVDYADRWPLTHLTWLFSNSLLLQLGVPTRVLLIARTADTWPAVKGALDKLQASTSWQPLDPLADGPGPRTQMFTAARAGFAARYGLPDPIAVDPPAPLTDTAFGLTLAVHVAALVAVDAHVTGQRAPAGMAALTAYLLDREQLHWANLYDSATARTAPDEAAYRTPPREMNRAVFTAALTGATPRAAGTAILDRLHPGLDARQVLSDHGFCYPASGDSARSPGAAHRAVLEPLYPDRLAEDFLALTLPGHDAEYPSQEWAPAVAAALLDPPAAPSFSKPGDVARTVTFLAAAAQRWSHVGASCLYPGLRQAPQAAMAGGSAVLTILAGLAPIDVLEALEAVFPEHGDYDLAPGIAAVAERLTGHRLAAVTAPAERASLYADLGYCYGEAGAYDQAFTPTQEAADIYRRLAQADPAAYLPDLAISLANLGAVLAEVGRREEALATTEEAVTIGRRLAEADPAAYLPDLAASLYNLGVRLAEVGRREEALATAEEAVTIRRRLTQADPAAYLPDLAASQTDLGVLLSRAGQEEDALESAQEAADIYRRLAQTNPAAYLPDLAMSLNNLGNRLSDMERREEALATAEEAVTIRRRLAQANPAAYLPDLAASLNNLGLRLSDMGSEKALAPAEEAVVIRRRLAEASPYAYLPDLARELWGSAWVRVAVGLQLPEALAAVEEAIGLYLPLAEQLPKAFAPDLLSACETLTDVIDGLSHDDAATELLRGQLAKVVHAALGVEAG